MIKLWSEHSGSDVVRIPKEVYEQMQGAEIQIAQPDDAGGDVFGRYVERGGSAVFLPPGVDA